MFKIALNRICSLITETSSALEVLRECAIQIYLLTYLLTSVVCSGVKSVASNEDVAVDHGSGDQAVFDQIIDLTTDTTSPALGDAAPKSAPLIAFD